MKKVKVVFLEDTFEELKKGLEWDGKERAAHILCHSSSYKDSIKLMPYKIIVPEEEDYVSRSAGHYEVDKPFINKVMNEAISTQSDFIQSHIHPGPGVPGYFSSVDKDDEIELMRHFASKIEGIYHGSLVFGNSLDDLTLDGWFYDRDIDDYIPIEKVIVVGRNRFHIYIPPRSPLHEVGLTPSQDRTIKAFGSDAVRMLRYLDFGVVGVSALGGPTLEFLARDNVNSITVCDFDEIDETNLNRLPGTAPGDVGKPKVEFYEGYLKGINPDLKITGFKNSFYDDDVQMAFSQADIIFGCVDSEARLSINRLALANLTPYFDMGAGIVFEKDENGEIEKEIELIGGQVYQTIPGREICLNCTGVFSDLMVNFLSPEDRETQIGLGYINDEKIVNPLVHFLDYTIAGLGYQQMLKYLWNIGKEDIFKVGFNGVMNKLLESSCMEAGCINCRSGERLGQGEKIAPFVPLKSHKFDFELLRKMKYLKDNGDSDPDSDSDGSNTVVIGGIEMETVPLIEVKEEMDFDQIDEDIETIKAQLKIVFSRNKEHNKLDKKPKLRPDSEQQLQEKALRNRLSYVKDYKLRFEIFKKCTRCDPEVYDHNNFIGIRHSAFIKISQKDNVKDLKHRKK